MPTSAPGSEGRRRGAAAGFSLIELLVVVAGVALAAGLVALALPDPQSARLLREGERLVLLLESARAEARGAGLATRWRPAPGGFRFEPLPPGVQLPQAWLAPPGPRVQIVAADPAALRLGPEPVIGPQRLRLELGAQALWIETDGLGPFRLREAAPGGAR